jgi:hypothetical protein
LILPISTFKVAGITDVFYHSWPQDILETKLSKFKRGQDIR